MVLVAIWDKLSFNEKFSHYLWFWTKSTSTVWYKVKIVKFLTFHQKTEFYSLNIPPKKAGRECTYSETWTKSLSGDSSGVMKPWPLFLQNSAMTPVFCGLSAADRDLSREKNKYPILKAADSVGSITILLEKRKLYVVFTGTTDIFKILKNPAWYLWKSRKKILNIDSIYFHNRTCTMSNWS